MFRIFTFFAFISAVLSNSFIDRFEHWINDFGIKYSNQHKYLDMYDKWVSNDKFIDEINSKNLSYTLGHNQFSGMDTDDFTNHISSKINRGLFIDNDNVEVNLQQSFDLQSLPASVNWVEMGAVTEIKNQGQCGSCWSFSTTGALEGAYFVKYGELLSFSEQQLVDCDNFKNGGRDMGCNGGLMDNAFKWISKNGGICAEVDYPYFSGETMTNGACQKSCSEVMNTDIKSYVDVIPSSDDEMMSALSKQPVSVAIQANQRTFQLYKSGILTDECGTDLDHGVLLVGYGNMNNENYYIIKNSWGKSWGMDGYIYLGRGSEYNKGDGLCGVLLQGSYPCL